MEQLVLFYLALLAMNMEVFLRRKYVECYNKNYLNVHSFSRRSKIKTLTADLLNRLINVDFNKQNLLVMEMQNILENNTNLNCVE